MLGATENGGSRLLCKQLDLQTLLPYDSRMLAAVELTDASATTEAHGFESALYSHHVPWNNSWASLEDYRTGVQNLVTVAAVGLTDTSAAAEAHGFDSALYTNHVPWNNCLADLEDCRTEVRNLVLQRRHHHVTVGTVGHHACRRFTRPCTRSSRLDVPKDHPGILNSFLRVLSR